MLLAHYVKDEDRTSYYVPLSEFNNNPWFIDFVACLFKHDSIRRYHCMGISYRGMYLTEHDLSQYKVGEIIVNKALLSTTKQRKLAEFLSEVPAVSKRRVVCCYIVNEEQTATYLESFSEFPEEQEVLIRPATHFLVTKIKNEEDLFEITLEQRPFALRGQADIEVSGESVTIGNGLARVVIPFKETGDTVAFSHYPSKDKKTT
jgi:hypothetical protein